jgi:hypothetical protein
MVIIIPLLSTIQLIEARSEIVAISFGLINDNNYTLTFNNTSHHQIHCLFNNYKFKLPTMRTKKAYERTGDVSHNTQEHLSLLQR